MTQIYHITTDKKQELEQELEALIEHKMPDLAKRIDEARQNGDLSENAEYHAAREDMGWAKGRVEEIKEILDNSEIIEAGDSDKIRIGSTFTATINGTERTFTIVGAQEADPMSGKISNESPLGKAFLGKKKGSKVEIVVPAGTQIYEIQKIS